MAEVTVGIPFYNCEDTLADTVRSVFAQRFRDWELILIDDGSTDGSLALAQSIADDRVRVVSEDTNRGIGARRKQIVDMAKGRYLAWQDADDLMHPDRLGVQYRFLESHPDVDILDTSYFTVDPNRNILRLLEKDEGYVIPAQMAEFPCLTNGTSMARTDLYRRFSYDEGLRRSEDWDVWLKALGSSRYYHIPDALYYRLDADSNQRPRISRELVGPRFNSRIYLRYGPKYLGVLATAKLIARLYVRAVYRITMIALGQHRRFRVEKTNALTAEALAYAEQGLASIMETRVPGISTPA